MHALCTEQQCASLQVTILSPSPGPLPGKFLLAGSLKLFME